MAASRALSRSLGCQSCQIRTLNAFAAFAGLSIPVARLPPPARQQNHRPFATGRRLRVEGRDAQSAATTEEDLRQNALEDNAASQNGHVITEQPASLSEAANTEDTSIPWYLRDQELDTAISHQKSPQQLPELPHDPPDNLETMVEHLFTDIGLDDLKILDLRRMHPPPALGGNLLMIVGTARSEKHLHVSADRFCRWLRSTYKFRPYADGLIGRNELKLKLRRKARRAKLLGTRAIQEGEVDDGIRTDWICVNVGAISESTGSRQEELEQAGIVGFSSASGGVHLVVQMMTEGKREELGLEKLWLDALAKQDRKDAKEMDRINEEAQVGGYTDSINSSTADTTSRSSQRTPSPLLQGQIRTFHTARRLNQIAGASVAGEYGTLLEQAEEGETKPPPDVLKIWHEVEAKGMRSRMAEFRQLKRPRLGEAFESALEAVAKLPEEEFLLQLEHAPGNLERNELLRTYFENLPTFPGNDYWICQLWIALYGMLLGHPDYTHGRVLGLFARMEEEVPVPAAYLYELAVEALVPCPPNPCAVPNRPHISLTSLAFLTHALRRLVSLDSRFDGQYVFERLYLAKLRRVQAAANRTENSTSKHNHLDIYNQFVKMHRRMGTIHGAYNLSSSFQINALASLADLSPHTLEPFLQHWSRIPIYTKSRTRPMYELFWSRLARSGNRTLIEENLDEWLDFMSLENPPVSLDGEVARNVMECLKVVKPDVEELAARGLGKEYHVRLWRRCLGQSQEQSQEQSQGQG